MKAFDEALKDGFQHITEITDPKILHQLRADGIQVDDDGYWSYAFGEHKEYEVCIEPIHDEGMYALAIYKNRVLITEKVPIRSLKKEDLDNA